MAEKGNKPAAAPAEPPAAGGGSSKKIMVIVLVAVLATAGITGGVVYFMFGGDKGAAKEEHVVEAPKKPIYIPIKAFNSNLTDGGPAKVMQIEFTLMSYQPELTAVVERHMPSLRNEILNYLSTVTYQDAASVEGKTRMKTHLKQSIEKQLLELEGPIKDPAAKDQEHDPGKPPKLEAVYITRLVMQ